MSMSLSSPPLSVPILSVKSSPSLRHPQALNLLLPKRTHLVLLARSVENGAGVAVEVNGEEGTKSQVLEEKGTKRKESFGSNGATVASEALKEEVVEVKKWSDPRWVAGTWDLEKFKSGGKTDWDAVIDAEVRRRKWLQDYPETSSNDDPVVFDTSIIPWWCWVKKFHLPEAERLNGRAAMIGFFMAYFVDSLTGVGLVDQMGNFFCKTLLLIAVLGVLFIRKNEDIEKLKKLFEETTFYDKQWQATWEDNKPNDSGKI